MQQPQRKSLWGFVLQKIRKTNNRAKKKHGTAEKHGSVLPKQPERKQSDSNSPEKTWNSRKTRFCVAETTRT